MLNRHKLFRTKVTVAEWKKKTITPTWLHLSHTWLTPMLKHQNFGTKVSFYLYSTGRGPFYIPIANERVSIAFSSLWALFVFTLFARDFFGDWRFHDFIFVIDMLKIERMQWNKKIDGYGICFSRIWKKWIHRIFRRAGRNYM